MNAATDTTASIETLLAGRPVLVTGADGFVGSHLTEALVEYGAVVHSMIRPASSGMLHNIADIRERLTIHRADLTDYQSVLRVLKHLDRTATDKPIVFHLGAQAHVGESWGRPYETVASNIVGTLNLLQSVVDTGIELFKFDTAGSSEEFGNAHPELSAQYRYGHDGGLLLDASSPLNPQSVYATSKVAADYLTRNYHSAYGIPALVTRMFNNYGPRQNPRFVTGTIITQALTRPYVELGYLQGRRDFCFVTDGAAGHIDAALFGAPGEVYVFGYGNHISIAAWYDLVIETGRQYGYWADVELRTNEADRGRLGSSEVQELRVDHSKLTRLTEWAPRVSWAEGLKRTIQWYASNRDRWIGRVDWA
jgi:dTDP-glucose 4,6-dehydratase